MNVINLEGAKWFIENYVKHKILDCYRNNVNCKELENTIKQLKDIRAMISKLISEAEDVLKAKKGISELSSVEYMTVAMYLKPNAPLSVKRKAQEIIYKYGLSMEQVKAIYESVFGRKP